MSRDEGQIRIRCPKCRTKYRISAAKAGRSCRCAQCQTKFRIPAVRSKERHVTTEDDILKWLNEGNDDDYVAPRPRVARLPEVVTPAAPDRMPEGKDSSAEKTDPSRAPKPTSRIPETEGGVLNDPMIFRKTG